METGSPEALPAASPVMPAAAPLGELALAQRRIAELERKIGQQVDLDFSVPCGMSGKRVV
jgi:hypothetical protein